VLIPPIRPPDAIVEEVLVGRRHRLAGVGWLEPDQGLGETCLDARVELGEQLLFLSSFLSSVSSDIMATCCRLFLQI
jgi:hypothetical protein